MMAVIWMALGAILGVLAGIWGRCWGFGGIVRIRIHGIGVFGDLDFGDGLDGYVKWYRCADGGARGKCHQIPFRFGWFDRAAAIADSGKGGSETRPYGGMRPKPLPTVPYDFG